MQPINKDVEADSEVSVTFVTNERITGNKPGIPGKRPPTDVISFAMEELGEGEVELVGADIPRVLGWISLFRFQKQ